MRDVRGGLDLIASKFSLCTFERGNFLARTSKVQRPSPEQDLGFGALLLDLGVKSLGIDRLMFTRQYTWYMHSVEFSRAFERQLVLRDGPCTIGGRFWVVDFGRRQTYLYDRQTLVADARAQPEEVNGGGACSRQTLKRVEWRACSRQTLVNGWVWAAGRLWRVDANSRQTFVGWRAWTAGRLCWMAVINGGQCVYSRQTLVGGRSVYPVDFGGGLVCISRDLWWVVDVKVNANSRQTF